MIVTLQGGVDSGTVYATGKTPDGDPFLAVADDWQQLHARLRQSAQVEGWRGWALITSTVAVQ
jgi:hypothetical protein